MTMERDAAMALVRRMLQAAGARDVHRLSTCYAENAVAVSPMFGEVRGRTNIVASWETLMSTFSGVPPDVFDVLVDGDRVAVLTTVTITDRIGWFGLPATGIDLSYRLVLLFTIADGAIVRDERIYDSTGVIERLEKARVDKELRTAADVQRTLLSRTTHAAPFCEAVGNSLPCRAIGGDFFEFVPLPSGDVGVAMGDVAGKGPAAALLAALVQGMFAVEAPAASSPSETITRINRRLAERRLESRFATLVYGVLSPDGRLAYSNAGHNPPAVLTQHGVARLTAGGPILGAFGDASFEQETVSLADGDTLVMFTDGVTEARNAAGEEFGEERLIACVEEEAGAPPSMLLQRIFSAVREFGHGVEQSDDVTAAVTRLTTRSAAR